MSPSISSTPSVDTVNVHTGMLRRVPTTSELAIWAPTVSAPTRLALVTALYTSTECAAR